MKHRLFLLIMLLGSIAWRSPKADVVLTASVDSNEYVVREPVKIELELANATPDTVRMFPLKDLGNHMRHMFVEVTCPDGTVEWRKFLVVSYTAVRLVGYKGVPLIPGTRVNWSLYPYMTYLIGPPSNQPREKGLRFTFEKPGTYRFRVAYCVEPGRHFLWQPQGGILYSNSVELRVREPDSAEKTILDAVWSGDRFGAACGDNTTHLKCDEQVLRSAIQQYPLAPMTRYARFNLARTLAYSANPVLVSEGIGLLDELARSLPEFRPEEVMLHRANALALTGRTTDALEIFDQSLERFPHLVDDFNFTTRRSRVNLVLCLELAQPSLVPREPVKLKATLENTGPDTVRIMPARLLGSNMTHMYYQVIEPDGTSVKRYHSFAHIEEIVNPEYLGEPLAPGERIVLFFYPTLSRSMKGEPRRNGFTFDQPGQYKLRLVYLPPANYPRLWRPVSGAVLSNEVMITIRAGTTAENDILDAYWSAGRADLAMGDGSFYIDINEGKLRRALEKNPEDPLTNYVRFNLAKGLLTKAISDPEGIALLEELAGKDFRFEEVRSALAGVYSVNGQKERALSILFSAIAARPELLDNYPFMYRVILTDLGLTGQNVIKWEMECANGQRRRYAGAAIPPELLIKQE